MKRVLISTGDSSGDLILAKVLGEIKKLYPADAIEFVGLCGPACQAEGARNLASTKDVAVVGIVEVVKNLRKIFGVLKLLANELPRVDSVLCVDFPDFNLKLSERAAAFHKPVDYIIAPQVWAWREGRLPRIKRLVRRIYPALPFEEEILRAAGVDAKFLGHPLRDALPPRARGPARKLFNLGPDDFVMCLMPGSRDSEMARHLPLLVHAWREMRTIAERRGHRAIRQALLPLAKGWTEAGVRAHLKPKDLALFDGYLQSGEWRLHANSYDVMMAADFGWVASGTATLEAAYYQLPHILIYKLNSLSAFLVRQLSTYFANANSFVGLPNILLGKAVIPELLQGVLTPRRLAIETIELLANGTEFQRIKNELKRMPSKLGKAGASTRIAADLVALWH